MAERGDIQVPRDEPTDIEVDIELPRELYGTITTGKLVNVRYQLVAQLEIPWARDLEVSLPIVLHEDAGLPSGPAAEDDSTRTPLFGRFR